MFFGLNYAKLAGIAITILAFVIMGGALKVQSSRLSAARTEIAQKNVQIQSLGEAVKKQNLAVNEMMDRAKTAQTLLEKSQEELQQKQRSLMDALASTKGRAPGTCAKARVDVDAILKALK